MTERRVPTWAKDPRSVCRRLELTKYVDSRKAMHIFKDGLRIGVVATKTRDRQVGYGVKHRPELGLFESRGLAIEALYAAHEWDRFVQAGTTEPAGVVQ